MDSDNPVIKEEIGKIERTLDRAEMMSFSMADLFIKISDSIEKRNLTDENEKLSCYSHIAFQLRSSGENTRAEEFIKKAEQCEGSNKFVALFNALRNSIRLERAYQNKVIEFLSASLKDNLKQDQELEVTLLLGEMNRRTEKYDEANKYYSKLMEKSEALPELYFRTIKFATGVMGLKDNEQQKAFDKIEEKKIYAYLDKLNNPYYGEKAAIFLYHSNRRDIIFPKLAEIIKNYIDNNQNSYKNDSNISTMLMDNNDSNSEIVIIGEYDPNFALNNAISAISDETKEAADLLYALLDKGFYENQILEKLTTTANYLPSEKFVQRLNNATDSREIKTYATILKIIGDKPSFEALITKAEKVLNDEGLKNLVYKEYEGKRRDACFALADSLAFFRGKKTIDFLVNLCERIFALHKEIEKEKTADKKIDYYDLGELYEKAGNALEIMFFRHFGFNRYDISRKNEPQTLKSYSKPRTIPEEPLNNFKKWYSVNGNKNYKSIVYEGFRMYGYDILPVTNPNRLYLLVEGLEDPFSAARVQCYKEIVRRTGIKISPNIGLNSELEVYAERQSLISGYTKWLNKNISKLVYDEQSNKFIIKE